MKRGLTQVDEIKASMTSDVKFTLATRTVVENVWEKRFKQILHDFQEVKQYTRDHQIYWCEQCEMFISDPMEEWRLDQLQSK